MWEEVSLPLWVALTLALLAAVATLDRLVVPLLRWLLRKRRERHISALNMRLELPIHPFKLVKRRVLIERLLADPEVLAAVSAHAAETGVSREAAMAKAAGYAREIVPSFSATTYFRIGTGLARRVSEALYRVRLGTSNDAALRAVPPDAAVVFVVNHRSNMDYILLTYVAAAYSALSYAVGEWAQVWGLRGLIRSMGAYFIRRNSREPLYRKVLARYVDMATKAGVVQAVFPEGGLSRTGALQPPRLGLLSYMILGFDPQGPGDIVFVPVGINYDRVIEDRVLISTAAARSGEPPRFRFNAAVLLGFLLKNLWLLLTGAWRRYGYAAVSFGPPVSLKTHLAAQRIDLRTLPPAERTAEIERLGQTLMAAVGAVVPPLPVSLIATALADAEGTSLTLFELKGRVFGLIEALERCGAQFHIPRADRDQAIDTGIELLARRHLVVETGEGWRIEPEARPVVAYYAAAIAHLLPALPQAGTTG